jgi:hypothetical protein
MNAQHERNLHLRDRVKPAQLDVPWRTNGLVAQIVFFLLTCVALGAFYGLLEIIDGPSAELVVGVAAIALAEYLIGARRWFFTGVETALWFAGVFALISALPSSGKPEAMLVLGAGAAIVGVRVRNPLFGAVAGVFVMLYFEKRFDLGVLAALAIALLACIALLRTWRRPTTEGLWIALALLMPIAGLFTADEGWRDVTVILYAMLGVIAFVLAITKRHHALFLTAMIAFGVAATDLAARIATPLEAKLALGGASLLAIVFAVSRVLRDRTAGFVLTPAQLTTLDETMEIGATIALQPVAATPEVQAATGGGSFGGAGASGDY